VIYEGSGFDPQEPILVSEMGEETESRIIKLKCVKLIDPAEWTNNFPFFDVMVNYGAGEVQIRIDANTNIWGTDAPLGTFGVTGIGGQYDPGLPLLDSYTLMPRSLDDFTEPVVASFSVPNPVLIGGDPVVVENTSTGAAFYQWSFGNGTFSNEEEPVLTYEEAGTFNIFLTATDPTMECSDQASMTVDVELVDGVQDAARPRATAHPNPASDVVFVNVPLPVAWRVHNAQGREVALGQWARGQHTLEVADWPAGVYNLSFGAGLAPIKVVVSRP